MKINYQWQLDQTSGVIDIIANPSDRLVAEKLNQFLQNEVVLTVINFKNNRQQKIQLNEVNQIEAFAHLSKVCLIDGREFLLQKKLKALTELERNRFYRINKSVIVNMDQVESFVAGTQARLEIFMKNGAQMTVSRHYAKEMKERLL